MIWRIQPDDGYCLFFTKRKTQRCIMGRATFVWLWEEWVHVPIYQFTVSLSEKQGEQFVVISTKEGLECDVNASFIVQLGGPEDGREQRITKAIELCAPTRKQAKKVDPGFFEVRARECCMNSVVGIVKKISFVDLISADDKMLDEMKAKIQSDVTESLAGIGLLFIGPRTLQIIPKEPKGINATDKIRSKWREYIKLEDDDEVQREGQGNEHNRLMLEKKRERENDELAHQLLMEQAHSDHEQKKAEQKKTTAIALKKAEEEEKKDLTEIEKRMKEIDFEYESFKADEDAKIEEEKEDRTESLRVLKHNNEHKQTIRQIDMEKEELEKKKVVDNHRLDHEIAIKKKTQEHKNATEEEELAHKLEMERKKTDQQIEVDLLQWQHKEKQVEHRTKLKDIYHKGLEKDKLIAEVTNIVEKGKIDIEKMRGDVEAEVLKQKVLGQSAHTIQLQELVMKALPQIVQSASKPIEKMGEIRTINFGGQAGDGNQTEFVGQLLASATSLPLLREIVRFIKDLDISTSDENSD